MPHYQIRGKVPGKRHVVFKKPNGELYSEELVSAEGFSNIYSIIYHQYAPTQVSKIDDPVDMAPKVIVDKNLQNRSFKGFDVKSVDDYMESRKIILTNDDVNLIIAAPRKSMTDYFFKNSDADEMIFIHRGTGTLKSVYGDLVYKEGDHLIIPKGTTYQIELDGIDNKMFIVESKQPFKYPSRYTNNSGQLLESSPFHERDIRTPQNLVAIDETGDFLIKIKRNEMLYPYHYQTHPFDAIGWDGNLYPFAFSIYDFEPLTGRIHQPPPIHQTFETNAMVICAFVPRLYDYHPESIPAPYHHSNIDADEVLYYVDGDFMSRNNIQKGQITLHPMGLTHGPHPGAIEKSVGKKETKEYAVMVDTFKPLKLTVDAVEIEDADYYKSWLF